MSCVLPPAPECLALWKQLHCYVAADSNLMHYDCADTEACRRGTDLLLRALVCELRLLHIDMYR